MTRFVWVPGPKLKISLLKCLVERYLANPFPPNNGLEWQSIILILSALWITPYLTMLKLVTRGKESSQTGLLTIEKSKISTSALLGTISIPHTRVIRRETTHSKLHLYYIPVGLFCIWIIVGEGEWKRAWESLNRLKYTALKTAFYTQLNWLNVVTWNLTLRPTETTTSPMGTICRGRLYNRPACIWDEGGLGGNGVGRNCNVGLHWR